MHVIRTLRQTHTDVKLVLKHNMIVDLPHSVVSVTNANTINYKHIHSNTERDGERDNTKKRNIKSHIFRSGAPRSMNHFVCMWVTN